MTLGKGHLMATLPLFVAAMAYNIWYFTQGSATTSPRRVNSAAAERSAPSVAGDTAAPVDPAQIPAVPDVVLDQLPQWRRNPFVSTRAASAPGDPDVVEAALPAAEPDIVIEAIFTPADRPARARVNGETVRVGDRIGTATVIEIQAKAIVIESPTLGRKTIVPQRRGGPR